MDIGTPPVDLSAEEFEPAQEANGGEGDGACAGGACDVADHSAGEVDPAVDLNGGVHLSMPRGYAIRRGMHWVEKYVETRSVITE